MNSIKWNSDKVRVTKSIIIVEDAAAIAASSSSCAESMLTAKMVTPSAVRDDETSETTAIESAEPSLMTMTSVLLAGGCELIMSWRARALLLLP